MDSKNKKVLITGASVGIGKALALKMASEGAIIALHYYGEEKAAQLVLNEVHKLEAQAFLIAGDFNKPEEAINVANEAWDKLDGIDCLINNAGVSYKTHFLDATIKDIDYFLNINYKSTLLLTQAVARRMVEVGKKGSIYTITSINALQPGVGLSLYGATKGALETLMKGVALELAPHQINVNTIAAGAIRTQMTAANWQNSERLQLVNGHIPLGRMGEVEEVADVIVNLIKSGTYMTGATIVLDGGWTLNQGYVNPQPYHKA